MDKVAETSEKPKVICSSYDSFGYDHCLPYGEHVKFNGFTAQGDFTTPFGGKSLDIALFVIKMNKIAWMAAFFMERELLFALNE